MASRIRSTSAAFIFLVSIVALTSAFNLPNRSRDLSPQLTSLKAAKPAQHRTTLTFLDRVAYQRAIEEVYWRHRTWPKENVAPKPPLDQVMSHAEIEKKVEDYLRNSQALEDYWQRPARNASHNDAGGPITPDQLQAEMERIASHTKQPAVLREIFAALGNDPFVIAECLARPVLAGRLVAQFNGVASQSPRAKSRDPVERSLGRSAGCLDSARNDILENATYTLPEISVPRDCTDDTWTATSTTGAPGARVYHTAVWTGTEMIIWGGYEGSSYLNTGGRYNPSTDSWTATSTTNAPTARELHTAVWTGSEMIVWSGYNGSYLNTGGRYNPSTDSWTATNTASAPAGRAEHRAVWTGSEMIIWGGYNVSSTFNSGGRYDPSTDSWTATSTTNAPSARYAFTAIWSGTEMIVWGGCNGSNCLNSLNSGGRYDPTTDNWTATSTTNAPSQRGDHAAVWSGSEMIVWGGRFFDGMNHYLNTGGRYNPSTDSWTATNIGNAPAGRSLHTTVWTGSEMIVWGGGFFDGTNHYLNTGGRYNPSTDSWTATSITYPPDVRVNHTAVWTGSEMIVWAGFNNSSGELNTGGRYCAQPPSPCTDDTWTPTTLTNAPGGRTFHTAVWTGSEMIVWGGVDFSGYLNTGGRYNPTTDSWTATSTASAPAGREIHTAVWTGSEMTVWGGYNGSDLNTGGRYNPSTDSWTATSTTNAPAARDSHAAVWTGNEMIVWGGFNSGSYFNTGGRYNPSTDNWAATSTTNAPDARALPTAVWTSSEMITWGGFNSSSDFNTGGRYNPGTDTWTATNTTNAPAARDSHTAIWTGSEMIIWGGETFNFNLLNTGGRYNPSTGSWIATSTAGAPAARDDHTAVWTSSQMIIWGGFGGSFLSTGGRYNPSTDSWTATSTTGAPAARDFHTAVWTGSQMIIWGGAGPGPTYFNTGGRYCAQTAPMAQSAFSRKVHGAAGTFDIPLPLTGNVGIECRSGGPSNNYQMIINFASNVTVESASVTSGTGSVSSFTVNGPQVTVNLTGVINVQRLTMTLHNVNDGTHTGDVPVSMGVLIGDTTGNGLVNAGDVSQTKSQVGQAVTMSNFREDVNASGTITATDVAIVKSDVGTSLPP